MWLKTRQLSILLLQKKISLLPDKLLILDWKDLLAQKIASGEIEREEFVEDNNNDVKQIQETIEVILDKKGRKGKTATLAVGFKCDDTKLKEIASTLKSRLSTGGSARAGEILIQGERKEELKKILKEMGYRVK